MTKLPMRILAEALLFLALLGPAFYLLRDGLSTEAILIIIVLYVVTAFAALSYYANLQALQLEADLGLAQATLWDLVRLLENNGIRNAGRRAVDRANRMERFAVKGAKEVGAGKPLPMGDVGALDITSLGFELIDRNEKDSGGHWRRVNGIRRGCYAWLMLVEQRNPGAAYRALCVHMVKQREDATRGLDNFTEFKMLLGLPIDWPEGEMVEDCFRRGITFERAEAAMKATGIGLGKVYAGLEYKPWPAGDEPQEVYTGHAILTKMREYMR